MARLKPPTCSMCQDSGRIAVWTGPYEYHHENCPNGCYRPGRLVAALRALKAALKGAPPPRRFEALKFVFDEADQLPHVECGVTSGHIVIHVFRSNAAEKKEPNDG